MPRGAAGRAGRRRPGESVDPTSRVRAGRIRRRDDLPVREAIRREQKSESAPSRIGESGSSLKRTGKIGPSRRDLNRIPGGVASSGLAKWTHALLGA